MIKAKKNIGIIKHLSKYLPGKTLNQMYKALVRLVYCDIIYHIPPKINTAPQLSTFDPPPPPPPKWEKLKEYNTKQLLLLLVHGTALIAQNLMKS